jgi:hypothetical protein
LHREFSKMPRQRKSQRPRINRPAATTKLSRPHVPCAAGLRNMLDCVRLDRSKSSSFRCQNGAQSSSMISSVFNSYSRTELSTRFVCLMTHLPRASRFPKFSKMNLQTRRFRPES